MTEPAYTLTPVAWLIDEGTEHARVLLGSDYQLSTMGAYNKMLVTLLDAQEAVHRAVLAERERCIGLCSFTDGHAAQREHGAKLAALISMRASS